MKIYTKTGDHGEASLFSGERLFKGGRFFEALGALDELNAALAMAHDSARSRRFKTMIGEVQRRIFRLSSDLATRYSENSACVFRRISADDTKKLETDIDKMTEKLAPLSRFILPGGLMSASAIHLARAICRRAEREVFRLAKEESLNPEIPIYLNRLSDYLFTLARALHKDSKKKEITIDVSSE